MVAVSDAPAASEIRSLGISLQLVTDPATIETEWRSFAKSAVGHVFAEYDFVSLWLCFVAPERHVEPRIIVMRDADARIVAILPFGLRSSLGLRVLEWLGGDQADYPGGLIGRTLLSTLGEPGATRAFVDAAFEIAGGDLVRFEHQLADLGGFPNPFVPSEAPRSPDDAHHTLIGCDWDAYYTRKRKASSRRLDRKKLKKLEAIGELRFVATVDGAPAEPIMEALFSQKRRGLADRGIGDLFATPGVRDFYRALAARPYPAGPSHVAALLCGDMPVATNWGLVRGDRYYYVMHSFAEGPVVRASPGQQLMYRLMQWCMANGIGMFDFSIGDTAYKYKWCETTVPLFTVTLARNARGSGLAAAMRGTTALKRLIKTTPALWRAAEFARRRLGRRLREEPDEGEDGQD